VNTAPCFVTRAEDSYATRQERREAREERARETLSAEFMAAACMPLIATVSVPVPGQQHRRDSFMDTFFDDLTARKNRDLAARAISILMRSVEGQEVVKTLAEQHADFYCEDAAREAA